MVTPHKLTVRSYGVGFGDCFLLTFHYGGETGDRHVLIDYGSTQKPPNARKNLLGAIAQDILKVVGKQLHVIVATHRHTDHISGFATNAKGTETGDLIAKLKPQLVIQPWTERPDAPKDWKGPGKGLQGAAAEDALRLSLAWMAETARVSLQEAAHLPKPQRDEIKFMGLDFVGDDGLKNRSAVENLARMGKGGRAQYVNYGSKIPALAKLLPGVKVEVLGPPTIAQKADVANQNPKNAKEYWNFAGFWNLRAAIARMASNGSNGIAAKYERKGIAIENRWFVYRIKGARGAQLLRIVRAMDDAMNNTSVILLMTAGKKKFLFPGDAQWENWEYAISKRLDDLRDVDVYKVGHHGSLNATPKTLWNAFKKKSKDRKNAARLCTVMSTRSASKHGHKESGTEVPREKLVQALETWSNLHTTQELEPKGDLVLKIEFDLG